MDLYQFVALQTQLWNAFGYPIRWWLILFAASGVGLAGLIFFLVIVRAWLDRS